VYTVYTHKCRTRRQGITIVVSFQSPEPIYRQIEAQIVAALLSGELAPGTELPSIRHLAQDLRVSVITTKRAYEELERGGYILTLPGRGSFAAEGSLHAQRARRLGELRAELEGLVSAASALGLGPEALGEMLASIYKEREDA
jgi:GntR family transcriptional regulator